MYDALNKNTPNVEITILETWEELKSFRQYVESNNFQEIVLDTETDNKIEKLANLYGIGLCFQDNEAFYIPIRKLGGEKWWNTEQERKLSDWIFSLCKSKKLIGHNIIYDVLVLLNNWGFDLTDYIYSDTILQKHCVDEERPFGLKEVGVKYLGNWADKAQEALYNNIEKNGGRTTKEHTDMFKADTEVLGEYCAFDTVITKKLFDIFESKIKQENLSSLFYEEEIMPLYREVTIPMKKKGFNIDVNYFQNLNKEISFEIEKLKTEILQELKEEILEFEEKTLNKDYPIKNTGNFPKYCAEVINFCLPTNKEGKITLSKKEVDKILEPQLEDHRNFLYWLKGLQDLNPEILKRTQKWWFQKENPEEVTPFNIQSNNHLKWLFFEKLQETPLSKTEKGEPQVDDDLLENLKNSYSWVPKLIDYKKLSKLRSVYIEGILDRQIDGIVYSSFIQFGPPSGRYASMDPNLQNLPRVKEDDSGLSELVLKYVNSIKVGFIAPKGYKIVNADYSQLEPCAFSEACGDLLLQEVFHKKQDLYSSIAINVWNLTDASADKKAKNYLKNLYPEYRQKAKIIALAVVYGAEAGRISKLMGITYQEAQEIIDNYLNAYPGLRNYMEECNKIVCTQGIVKTKFGRTRHLPEAKRLYDTFGLRLLDKKWVKAKGLGEIAWRFKNLLNLAKNYRIQGVAAHVVNRAAVNMNKKFKELGLEAQIIAQVHDELTCIAKEEQSEQVKAIMKDCMENTTKIAVPLIAEPLIADNWAEAK